MESSRTEWSLKKTDPNFFGESEFHEAGGQWISNLLCEVWVVMKILRGQVDRFAPGIRQKTSARGCVKLADPAAVAIEEAGMVNRIDDRG
jgi:hypothetical protein